MVFSKVKDDKKWFSNLFKSATINTNVSSKGPITICTAPGGAFDRTIVENLGLRAILSSGVGEHDYHDRIFSARITLPKQTEEQYEALIFNFVVVEDSERLTLKMNTKALTLLIFIYPRNLREYVNRVEMDLELILAQTSLLPSNISDLLDQEKLNQFIRSLQKTVISLENETLLNYDEFTMIKMFDPEKMQVNSQFFLDEIL